MSALALTGTTSSLSLLLLSPQMSNSLLPMMMESSTNFNDAGLAPGVDLSAPPNGVEPEEGEEEEPRGGLTMKQSESDDLG